MLCIPNTRTVHGIAVGREVKSRDHFQRLPYHNVPQDWAKTLQLDESRWWHFAKRQAMPYRLCQLCGTKGRLYDRFFVKIFVPTADPCRELTEARWAHQNPVSSSESEAVGRKYDELRTGSPVLTKKKGWGKSLDVLQWGYRTYFE